MKKHLNYRLGVLLVVLVMFLLPVTVIMGQGDETVSVISDQAALRAEPNVQSDTIATLPRETLLSFVEFDESLTWAKVETVDGVVGWISRDDVWLNGPYIPPKDGFTRNAIDGQANDWERFVRPYTDAVGDSTGTVDLQAVRAFMNDAYLYVLVEVSGDTRNIDLLLLDIVTNTEGVYRTYEFALPRGRAGTLFEVTDTAGTARDASGVVDYRADSVELRIPLELLDSPMSLNLVAVRIEENTAAGLATTDELVEVIPAVVTRETEAPLDAEIVDYRVNLRAAPRTGRVLRVLEPGTQLSLTGRTADGAWLYVRLPDAFAGWVSAAYVGTGVDIQTLPTIE
jgi:SH3-like domain-containing protein